MGVPECCRECEGERESPWREKAEREGGASSLDSCQWEGYCTELEWEWPVGGAGSWVGGAGSWVGDS